MRKAELQAAVGKRVEVMTWSTHGPVYPCYARGVLLEVGDGGWNKVEINDAPRSKNPIKHFRSVSIKRVLDE